MAAIGSWSHLCEYASCVSDQHHLLVSVAGTPENHNNNLYGSHPVVFVTKVTMFCLTQHNNAGIVLDSIRVI
jgi:hypothetical protein